MENRIYHIIIVILLVVLAVITATKTNKNGKWQSGMGYIINTQTGETYILDTHRESWYYFGEPYKDVNVAEKMAKIRVERLKEEFKTRLEEFRQKAQEEMRAKEVNP